MNQDLREARRKRRNKLFRKAATSVIDTRLLRPLLGRPPIVVKTPRAEGYYMRVLSEPIGIAERIVSSSGKGFLRGLSIGSLIVIWKHGPLASRVFLKPLVNETSVTLHGLAYEAGKTIMTTANVAAAYELISEATGSALEGVEPDDGIFGNALSASLTGGLMKLHGAFASLAYRITINSLRKV